VTKALPLVSIVTPSFNQGRYIRETIESVLGQTYEAIELHVIDGGSTDETDEVVSRYRSELQTYVSEADTGQANAINKGLRLARGSYVMWLNSDDILLPTAIADVVKVFEQNPDIDLCHGKSLLFSDQTSKSHIIGAEDNYEEKYAAYMSFPQPSSFFRTNILNKIGYLDETLHFAMDFDFYLRIYLIGNLVYCPSVFSKYRLHGRSKSNDGLSFVSEWKEVFSRFVNSMDFGQETKRSLCEWGLHSGTKVRYLSDRIISPSLFEKIVFNHLFACANILYRYGDSERAREYLEYAKYYLHTQYRARGGGQLYLRSYLVPRALRGLRDRLPR